MLDPGTSFREVFQGRVNTEHETIYANIRSSLKRQLPQVQAHAANDYKVMLLCGGPSLEAGLRRIKALYRRGWKVFSVNGTHAWAREHGMEPSLHAMLDARPFNVRFVSPPAPDCRYLICSQCDPAVFDALAGSDVSLWHGAGPKDEDARIITRFYRGRWQPVMGGSSVGTRAIGLAYLLGVRSLRVFGMDCALQRGRHHAFEQSENDAAPENIRKVRAGRRRFRSHVWMLAQLDDWLQMAEHVPDDLNLSIEGDGLLAHIINETARMGRAPTIKVEG